MGQLNLTDVLQALEDAGFAAERGFPAGKQRCIEQPVCTVNLQAVDMTGKQSTVLIRVVSPMELGAAVCEDTALEVGAVLTELSGRCSIGACEPDARSGLITVEVKAVFATEKPTVVIDGVTLLYVQSFYAWRTVDRTVTQWTDTSWQFRMEEWIPAGEAEQTLPEENFTLLHIGDFGRETYAEGTWSYRKREWSPSGLRQTRMGIATDMVITQ